MVYSPSSLTFVFQLYCCQKGFGSQEFLVTDVTKLIRSALAARKANLVLGGIRFSITSQARERIVLHCSALHCTALGLPYLECWGQFWALQCKNNVKLLEGIQRRTKKMVGGLEGKIYEEQLGSLGLNAF